MLVMLDIRISVTVTDHENWACLVRYGGTPICRWGYWTPIGRSDGATSTYRLKTSSLACSVYSGRGVCECCQNGQ
jgi:hypothetical protein